MRVALLGSVLCMACTCNATDWTGAIRDAFWRLNLAGVFAPPSPMPSNPLEPKGFLPPGQAGDERRLPEPGATEERQLLIHRADHIQRRGNVIRAAGNVRFSYKGYESSCEIADMNLDSEVFVLEGNVSILGKYETVNCHAAQLDYKKGTYRYLDCRAVAMPGPSTGLARDNLYLKGASGFGDDVKLTAEQSEFTTCNLPHPHYQLDARNAAIRFKKEAVLRDVGLKLFNRTLLRIPYVVVPLNDLSDRYTPDVGQSPDEGYYVKTRIGTPLPGDSVFDTRIDYMTKLGNGFGGDYRYTTDQAKGRWQLYGITRGPRSVQGSLSHQQRLGLGTLALDGSYQRNNYLTAPSTTALSFRSQLQVPQRSGSTRLSFYRATNDTGTFSSRNQNFGLTDERRFGSRFNTSLAINYAESGSTGSSSEISRKQVDVNFRAQHRLSFADAGLEYRRSIPVGEVLNFLSSSDLTPMLSLRTDARRLMGERLGNRFPFDAELTLGELFDAGGKDYVGRGTFDFSFRRSHKLGRRPSLTYHGRFRQAIYDNDTAQYVLSLNSSFTYPLGPDTAFNLRYNHLRPYGFSPLSVDRTGETNVLASEASYRPIRSLLVGVETAFDMVQLKRQEVAWQNVGARFEWRPIETFRLRGNASYDTVQRSWSNLRFDLDALVGGAYVSAGARYDAMRKVWGQVNLYIDGFRVGRLRTSLILAYNGYLKKFETKRFAFIYDLHCAEAILQVIDNPVGFRSGREISFFVRLKALPWDTNFGIGRRGQGFGTGTGVGF